MDIKKTSLPAIIITVVMLGIAAFAVVSFIKKSNESDKKQEEKDAKSDKKESNRAINIPLEELSSRSYPEIAADMVQRIILDEDISKHRELLKSCDAEQLNQQLNNDELRLSFWINIYNGYTQYFLKTDPTLYKEDRNEFFKKEQISIAGYDLAMHDIEHGALRRGATIWSKGHIRIPFRNDFVNTFKLDAVDYRIHFALNCGAKSCPPVSVYLPQKTNGQLDRATKYYLNKECEYDKEKDIIMVPALMTWFSDDFGSRDDKRDILRNAGVISQEQDPKIEYKEYDWTMKVKNYRQF